MLKLWMPMNKDLRNQGLKLTYPSGGGELVDDDRFGKVWHTSSSSLIDTGLQLADWNWTQTAVGFGGWLKFNLNDVRTASAGTYTSTNRNTTTNIFGHGMYAGYSIDVISNDLYNGGVLNSLQIRAVARDSGAYAYTAQKAIVFDEWHHYYAQFNPSQKKIEMWVDGELFSSGEAPSMKLTAADNTFKINQAGIWGGNGILKNLPFYVHDVRLYNGMLSESSIKGLAKGIVFGVDEWANFLDTINILPPTISGSNISNSYGWDKNLHKDAISVTNASVGCNMGVQSAGTGYHAMWQNIDGIPTIVFNDINSQFGEGYRHRWLGVSFYGFSIPSGSEYTISMDAKASFDGKTITSGIYYKPSPSHSNQFYDGLNGKSITTEWKRYYWHYNSLIF